MALDKNEVLLNVAKILPASLVNGPGKRIVLWVQGCTLNCPGCFNQDYLPHTPKRLEHPEKVGNDLLRLCQLYNCEGITITGGEPFQQSQALAMLCEKVKAAQKTIVVFSGYNSNLLFASSDPHVQSLLSSIDILIAGPFNIKRIKYNRSWNDNVDKEIHYLTNAYNKNHYKEEFNIEFSYTEDLNITGFPSTNDIRHLVHEFEKNDLTFQKLNIKE